MKLAYEKHHGQMDKSGLPYIHHPLHLAEQMNTEEACIVALLHDVIEDTNTTFEDLEAFSFGEEIIDALKLLTRNKDEDYFAKEIKRSLIEASLPILYFNFGLIFFKPHINLAQISHKLRSSH